MCVHHRLPAAKIINHSIASSAYHPHRRGIFLLFLLQLNLAEQAFSRQGGGGGHLFEGCLFLIL